MSEGRQEGNKASLQIVQMDKKGQRVDFNVLLCSRQGRLYYPTRYSDAPVVLLFPTKLKTFS